MKKLYDSRALNRQGMTYFQVKLFLGSILSIIMAFLVLKGQNAWLWSVAIVLALMQIANMFFLYTNLIQPQNQIESDVTRLRQWHKVVWRELPLVRGLSILYFFAGYMCFFLADAQATGRQRPEKLILNIIYDFLGNEALVLLFCGAGVFAIILGFEALVVPREQTRCY